MLLNFIGDKIFNFLGLDKVKYSITQKINGREVPVLTFDTIEEFNLTASSTVTSYGIESGVKIADYKYTNPITINVKGIVSRSGITGGGSGTPNPIGTSKKQIIAEMEDKLEELRSNLVLVNIRGRTGRVRKNYTLKQYSINETADNYYLFSVDMSFEEVIRVGDASHGKKFGADTISSGISATSKI